MKVKTVFVYPDKAGQQSHATIDVPGLGEVKIIHALSTRLCEEIQAESLAALRVNLGQTLEAESALKEGPNK